MFENDKSATSWQPCSYHWHAYAARWRRIRSQPDGQQQWLCKTASLVGSIGKTSQSPPIAFGGFVKRLISLRQSNQVLRRESWRDGTLVTWLNPGGGEQTQEHWADQGSTTIGLRLTASSDTEGMNDVIILFSP